MDTGAGRVLGRWDISKSWFLISYLRVKCFIKFSPCNNSFNCLSLLFKSCIMRINNYITTVFWSRFCFLCLCLRFCGTSFPPDLTSSGPHMTVMFVADEGVADSGFNATYQAVSLLDSEFMLNSFSSDHLSIASDLPVSPFRYYPSLTIFLLPASFCSIWPTFILQKLAAAVYSTPLPLLFTTSLFAFFNPFFPVFLFIYFF